MTLYAVDKFSELLRMCYPGDRDRIEDVYLLLLEGEDDSPAADSFPPGVHSSLP